MKKLALTLAGGGSLGAYEVGAIKALQENGYKFDIVTGTSIGAINGYFVATNKMKAAEKLWDKITVEQIMVGGVNINKDLFSNLNVSSSGEMTAFFKVYLKNHMAADITPFKDYVRKAVDTSLIAKSPIKLGIVCAEYPTLKLVDVYVNDLDPNLILPYLHASSACAPAFPIEQIGDKKYIDGFYVDNLPIRLAFEYGATDVIAINMRLLSLKPQHSFYLSLPNVMEIAPYRSLGSLLDFSQEHIQDAKLLGYHDALKTLGKLKGFFYTFTGEFPSQNFLANILQHFGVDAKNILKDISDTAHKPLDEEGYFIRALEMLAQHVEIGNYTKIYTYEEMADLIRHKITSLTSERESMNLLKKKMFDLKMLARNITHKKDYNTLFLYFIQQYLGLKPLKSDIPLIAE